MRRRSLLIPALCAAALAAGSAAGPAAAAVRLALPVAHAARLQIPGAASAVIVGDPGVADAIVIDPHTIYVQAKTYGRTEVIVVDRAGREVWQGDIAVITPYEGGRVTVVRGPLGSGGGSGAINSMLGSVMFVTEMTCADVCTPVAPPPAAASKDSKDKK